MHYLLIKIQLLWAKHTKWLDRNPVKVPVSKRVIAYAIDWAVGGIISGFPAVLFYGGVTGRSDMFSDLYVFPSLNESGDELQYTPLFDFFPFETITRHVRVTISEETTVKFDRIIAKYNKVIEDKNKLNIMLIRDGVEDYIHKV